MNRPTLIVVADDFGLSPEVDAGILDAVQAGAVTTVDMFVNPPCRPDPGAIEATGAALGLHLNLTHGAPCSAPSDVPSLVDSARRFPGQRDALFPRLVASQARHEWLRQLDRFRELAGHEPRHLSVHKHLHRDDLRLFALAAELAHRCGASLRTLTPAMRDACRACGALTTDHFIGDVRPAPYWTPARLREKLATLEDGTTELMCHPGRGVKPIAHLWYLGERDVERETFCSPETRTLLARLRLVPCAPALFGRTT